MERGNENDKEQSRSLIRRSAVLQYTVMGVFKVLNSKSSITKNKTECEASQRLPFPFESFFISQQTRTLG